MTSHNSTTQDGMSRGKSPEQHTPGPWTYSNLARGVFDIIHNGDLLAQVWRVKPGCDGDLPAEANARLISVAPELLDACRLALSSLKAAGFENATVRLVEAAIAKATGTEARQ